MTELDNKHCVPCEGGIPALDRERAEALMHNLHESWKLNDDATAIERTFHFRNFYRTMAFVNTVAWIAHREDHHPDLQVAYGRCTVRYNTHAVSGLTDNDFICARQIDLLFKD